ncbi:hypothetical protein EVAR_29265_1 [Eumeta japonica]|uniref:Uncharacterized protein n=1 Tax=Eumeta variegata TaxID=151549 RepID=A0A4C1VII2_EUMVA|nr:hypothetical protein EVAR_29265_1 [Eumeta japonica]
MRVSPDYVLTVPTEGGRSTRKCPRFRHGHSEQSRNLRIEILSPRNNHRALERDERYKLTSSGYENSDTSTFTLTGENGSSVSALPFHQPPPLCVSPFPPQSDILFPSGNASVTPLELRVSMGGGVHLFLVVRMLVCSSIMLSKNHIWSLSLDKSKTIKI